MNACEEVVALHEQAIANTATPAVVIGLCAHGLAIARSLSRAGVPVFGVESRPGIPGLRTNCAEVIPITDMNGPKLIDQLLSLRPRLSASGDRPVLFPTNDRMTEQLCIHFRELEDSYRLSWQGSAEYILKWLRKDNFAARCQAMGLNYPKSIVWSRDQIAAADLGSLKFPIILKPIRPLGRLKTAIANSAYELGVLLSEFREDLPILFQEFIEGDDAGIQFAALILDRGSVRARFEGRKLRSRPMGHTTLAISEPDEQLHRLALQFFEGVNYTGPASVEFKSDGAGRRWVIEPTVGRSDFWVGLCIVNGVNLPLVEYCVALGQTCPWPIQSQRFGWVNGDRDPAALIWLLLMQPQQLIGRRWSGVYADRGDPRPIIELLILKGSGLPSRTLRWVRRQLAKLSSGRQSVT